jgi:hypothetical protein
LAVQDWLQVAQLVSSIAATFGLFLTAWQFVRTRRTADLQALQKFFETASAQEAALARATDHATQTHAFHEFLNFLEVYANAHNNGLFGAGSERMVRHKLEDSIIELLQSPGWHPVIQQALDRETTFEEIRKFRKKHEKEITARTDQREQRLASMQ